MIKILAHRGFWDSPEEKNSVKAFEKAIEYGFGIETDIRDYNGKLVISHDVPDSNAKKEGIKGTRMKGPRGR